MKLSVGQLMLGMFVVMWVVSDASGVPQNERWIWALTAAIITGYANNAHKLVWMKLRKLTHI